MTSRDEGYAYSEHSLGNAFLKSSPVPEVGGSDPPHVILQLSLADRTSGICFVGSLYLRQLAGGSESCIVDGLKDLDVETFGFRAVKGMPHKDERVRQSLHSDANGAVSHVGLPSLEGLGKGSLLKWVHVDMVTWNGRENGGKKL